MGLLFEEIVCVERSELEDCYWVRTAFPFPSPLRMIWYDVDLASSFMCRSLAPGAQTLLKPLTNPDLPPEERVNIEKQIRRLGVKDWALILKAFNDWPFAPDVSEHGPFLVYLSGMIWR